jgi:hypothetical protein
VSEKPSEPDRTEEKPRRRRRWWRWPRRILIGLILLLLIVWIALPFLVRPILTTLAEGAGLRLTIEDVSLATLAGRVELRGVVAAPLEGGEPIAKLRYLRGKIELGELLGGRIVLDRVEVDRLELLLERAEDGSWPLLDRLSGGDEEEEAADQEAPEAESGTGDREPVDFTPPVAIRALRILDLAATIRDAKEDLETEIRLHLLVSDVGLETGPARLDLVVTAGDVLENLRVRATALTSPREARGDLELRVRGLRPGKVAAYLRELGIRSRAEVLDVALDVKARATALDDGRISAEVNVRDLAVLGDGAEEAAIDAIDLVAASIGDGPIHLHRAAIAGVRAYGESLADGTVRLPAIDLVPRAGEPEVVAGDPEPGEPAPTAAPEPFRPLEIPLRVDDLLLTRVSATWNDPAFAFPLEAEIEELRVREFDGTRSEPARLLIRLACPDRLGALTIRGDVAAFAGRPRADLTVDVDALEPEAIRNLLGAETSFASADLGLRVEAALDWREDGSIRGDAAIRDLRWEAGDARLRLDTAAVEGALLDPGASLIRAETVRVDGLSDAEARKERDGTLDLLGLRFAPGPGPVSGPQAGARVEAGPPLDEPGTEPAGTDGSPIRLEVESVLVEGRRLRWRDETTRPEADVRVDRLRVALEQIRLGGPSKADEIIASFGITMEASELAEALSVDGRLSRRDERYAFETDVEGTAINLRAATPYLAAAGLESLLRAGDLRLSVAGNLSLVEGALEADVRVGEIRFADGDDTWFSCDGIELEKIVLREGAVAAERIAVVRPRASCRRDPDGSLCAAGMRFVTPTTTAATPEAAPEQPSEPSEPSGPPPVPLPTPAAAGDRLLDLGSVEILDGEIRWRDLSLDPPVDLSSRIGLRVQGVELSDTEAKGELRVEAGVPDHGTRVVLTGRLSKNLDVVRGDFQLTSEGLQDGPLGTYLGSAVRSDTEDGRITAKISAEVGAAKGGGQRLRLEMRDLEIRDGSEGGPLLAVESLVADIPRYDPEARVLLVDEIRLDWTDGRVVLDRDGSLRFLGFAFRSAEGEVAAAEPREAVPGDESPPGEDESFAPPSREETARRLLAEISADLPTIRIETLDLRVARFELEDRRGEKPLIVTDVRLWNPEPLIVLDEPGEIPPEKLRLQARVPAALEKIDVSVETRPFIDEPEFRLDLGLEGIHGPQLMERAPQLLGRLDAGELTEASLAGRIEGRIRWRRRHPLDFDLSNGFEMEIEVRDLAVRDASGTILAGVDEVSLDRGRFDPKLGTVRLQTVDIHDPRGRVVREKNGLRIGGLLLRDAPDAPPPGVEPPAASGPARPAEGHPAGADPRELPAEAPPPRETEFSIDELYVSGIDAEIEDVSVYPPFRFPLRDLAVEVRGLTTRALREPRPIRFATMLRGGIIELPLDEGRRAYAVEEITTSGELTLSQPLTGWAKIEVSALDLSNLSGLAKQHGVDLSGGTLDLGFDVRYVEENVADTSIRLTLTDLDMEEPPDGPLSKLLALPAPLNVVLFVLEDPTGAIHVPLSFRVRNAKVGSGAITTEALKVLTLQIAQAVASSPFKVVGTVGNLFGIGGRDDVEEIEEEEETIAYLPGDGLVRRDARETLDALIGRLRSDRDLVLTLHHEPGHEDLRILERRANPSRQDTLDLLTRLRTRRALLLEAREMATADARAAHASESDEDTVVARRRLSSVDRELGLVEIAIDRAASFLRPGAESRNRHRTRAAVQQLGTVRLQEALRILRDADVPSVRDRVRARRPRFVEPTTEQGRVVISIGKAKRR